MAGMQQRLGRDAAHVQAGAAQGFRGLRPQAFSGPSWAQRMAQHSRRGRADDDDVIVCHGVILGLYDGLCFRGIVVSSDSMYVLSRDG